MDVSLDLGLATIVLIHYYPTCSTIYFVCNTYNVCFIAYLHLIYTVLKCCYCSVMLFLFVIATSIYLRFMYIIIVFLVYYYQYMRIFIVLSFIILYYCCYLLFYMDC